MIVDFSAEKIMTSNVAHSSPVDAFARPEVRRRLNQELSADSDLDAFMLDHFAQTYRELTSSMNRTTKVNELFHRNSAEDIRICLDKYIIERNSNSLIKQIKKSGERKLKKTYILMSVFVGIAIEYFYGPGGKFFKAIAVIAGIYLIMTHSPTLPNAERTLTIRTPTPIDLSVPEVKATPSPTEVELRSQITALQNEMTSIRNALDTQENNVRELKRVHKPPKIGVNTPKTDDINTLKTDISTIKDDIKALKENITRIDSLQAAQAEEIEKLKHPEQPVKTKSEVEKNKKRPKARKTEASEPIKCTPLVPSPLFSAPPASH